VTPAELLELFDRAADAVAETVGAVDRLARRARTDRPGQYALDVVADTAACAVLAEAPVRIVSEESGVHERAGASVTVVLDPIDGSTNCSRGISYWATSICALDTDGPLAALVVNQASGARTSAVRGEGAVRDGERLRAATTTRVGDGVVGLGSFPPRPLAAKQTRMLGSLALELVDVAAGGLDGHAMSARYAAPWDYLGGLLACREAGAVVRDVAGEELVTADPDARRQLVAAGTTELADALAAAMMAP
jgi:fructose-1,6-bisphosphatase/inositol monophosphatase family enzyme